MHFKKKHNCNNDNLPHPADCMPLYVKMCVLFLFVKELHLYAYTPYYLCL